MTSVVLRFGRLFLTNFRDIGSDVTDQAVMSHTKLRTRTLFPNTGAVGWGCCGDMVRGTKELFMYHQLKVSVLGTDVRVLVHGI